MYSPCHEVIFYKNSLSGKAEKPSSATISVSCLRDSNHTHTDSRPEACLLHRSHGTFLQRYNKLVRYEYSYPQFGT